MLTSLFPAAACYVAPAPVLAAVVAHHLQEDLRRQAEGGLQAHLEPHSQGRAEPQGSRRLSLSLGRLQRSIWHAPAAACPVPPKYVAAGVALTALQRRRAWRAGRVKRYQAGQARRL